MAIPVRHTTEMHFALAVALDTQEAEMDAFEKARRKAMMAEYSITRQEDLFGKDNAEDVEFRDLRLDKVEIRDQSFQNCRFVHCKIAECLLLDCSFETCVFEDCDVSLIDVTHTLFRRTYFMDCKAIGINWTQASSPVSIHFKDCVINYSVFFGMHLAKMKLLHCSAHEVNFAEANLANAIFRETDFFKSTFSMTNLTKADFEGAVNYSIHPSHNTLKKTIFSLPEAISLLSHLDIVLK